MTKTIPARKSDRNRSCTANQAKETNAVESRFLEPSIFQTSDNSNQSRFLPLRRTLYLPPFVKISDFAFPNVRLPLIFQKSGFYCTTNGKKSCTARNLENSYSKEFPNPRSSKLMFSPSSQVAYRLLC